MHAAQRAHAALRQRWRETKISVHAGAAFLAAALSWQSHHAFGNLFVGCQCRIMLA
jgi:hypothetical protein